MMRKILLLGLLTVLAISGCGGGEQGQVYNNRDFGFAVNYPSGYQARSIKWVKEESGVELKKADQVITVQAMPTGTEYAGLSFDRYVRIAASVDIQNFTKLARIEPVTSAYNIKGYKTYWEVVQHEDTDQGENDRTVIAGPIFYFPVERPRPLGAQPVKAVMIYADEKLSAEAEEIAASFRYRNSFVTLLRNRQHGQLFWARQNKLFRIELAANPTTGYNWYISTLDEKQFRVRRSGYDPDAGNRVGGGGTSYWEIIPLKKGPGTIKLLYYRVWEGAAKAVDQFQVRVLVL
jgi:predicted secreted protein